MTLSTLPVKLLTWVFDMLVRVMSGDGRAPVPAPEPSTSAATFFASSSPSSTSMSAFLSLSDVLTITIHCPTFVLCVRESRSTLAIAPTLKSVVAMVELEQLRASNHWRTPPADCDCRLAVAVVLDALARASEQVPHATD